MVLLAGFIAYVVVLAGFVSFGRFLKDCDDSLFEQLKSAPFSEERAK